MALGDPRPRDNIDLEVAVTHDNHNKSYNSNPKESVKHAILSYKSSDWPVV